MTEPVPEGSTRRVSLGLAVLVALVGLVAGAALAGPVSGAAAKITGKDVKDSSLTGKDIRDGTIKSADMASTFVWRVNVSSAAAVVSTQAIPAGSVLTPIRAELTDQRCNGGLVDNPQAARFQISMVDSLAETVIVNHPLTLEPQATGASADRLRVALPDCGGANTGVLTFTFEVRAGGGGKAAKFR